MLLLHSSNLSLTKDSAGRGSRVAHVLRRCALVLSASVFVAACAHIAVPMPLTPVPFTLQPFAVLLVGMLLGPSEGFAALSLYLLEGAAGLPVFTPGGLPGLARLLGPTGGFLFAYPLAAALAGSLTSEGGKVRHFSALVAGGAVGMTLIYTCGALWFSHLLHVPFLPAVSSTVVPFAVADTVKVFVAAGIASTVRARGDRTFAGTV